MKDGSYRDNDLPTRICYHSDSGEIEQREWRLNYEWHRENDLPAVIEYYENGEIKSEQWYLNGKRHRENNKPAAIGYNENGVIVFEEWYLNGELVKPVLPQ